jgi:hypothetical protein
VYRADRPDPNAIARAQREAAKVQVFTLPDDAGIVDTTQGDPRVIHPRTLLLDPAVRLRRELIPVGLSFLHIWHIAAPLYDYNTLAFQHGTLEERQKTAEQIRDLRVPLYETRALFLRQCAETDALLAAWAREREGGGDERLAFHRALWEVKPLILPLPITWIEGKQV